MAGLTGIQKAGTVIVVFSFLIGAIMTIWSVYSSFTALDTAEVDGIGRVGDRIRNALWFSAGGLIGCVAGVLLVIFGKARRR